MKNVHVFVPVFFFPFTILIFQIKRIISSEKWCNYVATLLFFFENAKNLGRSDDGKQRKKRGWLNLGLKYLAKAPITSLVKVYIGSSDNDTL